MFWKILLGCFLRPYNLQQFRWTIWRSSHWFKTMKVSNKKESLEKAERLKRMWRVEIRAEIPNFQFVQIIYRPLVNTFLFHSFLKCGCWFLHDKDIYRPLVNTFLFHSFLKCGCWFLYDKDLCHERVNLTAVLIFLCFFYYF